MFVTAADKVDGVCKGICERFDQLIRLYYDPTDRQKGYIETKDRFGVQRRFPIMSVSIAAISLTRAKTYAGIAELAAVGKRAAKAILGSTYVRDGETMYASEPPGEPVPLGGAVLRSRRWNAQVTGSSALASWQCWVSITLASSR